MIGLKHLIGAIKDGVAIEAAPMQSSKYEVLNLDHCLQNSLHDRLSMTLATPKR
jgi:hypothetical protein